MPLLMVCTPLLFCQGWGVEPPTKFSKKGGEGRGRGGMTGSQFLEGDCWERGDDFFYGEVAVFTRKINKNLKYLMTKEVYKQKCFSLS